VQAPFKFVHNLDSVTGTHQRGAGAKKVQDLLRSPDTARRFHFDVRWRHLPQALHLFSRSSAHRAATVAPQVGAAAVGATEITWE
jgi:hypothetical protein